MGDHRAELGRLAHLRPDADEPHVIGRAWLRYWPFDTFGILPTPTLPGADRRHAMTPSVARR